eukprot:1717628-Heterocapsa_arctica.AAC.1
MSYTICSHFGLSRPSGHCALPLGAHPPRALSRASKRSDAARLALRRGKDRSERTPEIQRKLHQVLDVDVASASSHVD